MREQSLDADIQQTEQLDPHREREQNEDAPQSGDFASVNPAQKAHFFSVANAMLAAIEPNSPMLMLPDRLTKREQESVRLLFEARTGQETELGGGQISALDRLRYLNLGLAGLGRILSMARSPDFTQAQAHIEEMRKRLARLKDELQHLILQEEHKKAQEKDKKAEEDKKAAQDEITKKKVAAVAKA